MADIKTETHEAVVKAATEIRNELVQEWNKGLDRNYAKVDKLLNNAKVKEIVK